MSISKKELIKELRTWDSESLMELAEDINVIIKENSATVEVALEFDQFKGSGKCFVARIDYRTKKILDYVEPDRIINHGKYKGEQVYTLLDGCYMLNETGNKAQDKRIYIKVSDGEMQPL